MDVTTLPSTTGRSTLDRTPELTADPTGWSSDADNARRDVLAQLDAWCRRHDASRIFNSWVAEQAVQQI